MNLREAIDVMLQVDGAGNPKPFSIEFVTLNQSKRTGGNIRTISRAILNSQLSGVKKTQFRTVDLYDCDEPVPERRIKKVHTDLILEINGIAVL